MNALIVYLTSRHNYTIKYIEENFLSQEVKNILIKYNLTLHELCYRIKENILLDTKFICKYCGDPIKNIWRNKYFCCNNHSIIYRNKSKENRTKVKNTNLKKYGVSAPMKLHVIKEKAKETCVNKYNVDNYVKTQECKDKYKKTCLKKYGVDNFSKSNEFKQQYDNIQKSIKNTCNKKYNSSCWSQSLNYKTQVNSIVKKRYITLKKNNSFNKSDFENNTYQLLLIKFNKDDILRQYRSELYPFICDFYIKSINLYIECNGHWTHGTAPFNKNNAEHIELLNKWKLKNTKFYKNAINTWTIKDPLKYKIAKERKLNYKIFWNIIEVKNWVNGIN